MKCLRKTYGNETYSQMKRRINKYNLQHRKSNEPYSRRYRTCAHALEVLLYRSPNRMAFWNAWTKISNRWPDKKKWQ